MYVRYVFLFCFVVSLTISVIANKENYIDDFTENGDPSQWSEHSDTVRNVGKSKAIFSLQQTPVFRRAILFTLLNPQPCGAAFAGVRKSVKLDLHPYTAVSLKVRGQGQYKGYKLIFKQTGSKYSYCNFFEAPSNFEVIEVPIDGFKAYHEGKLVDGASAKFDKSQIEAIGIQAYGGRYLPMKQSGVSCLEIDWIRLE